MAYTGNAKVQHYVPRFLLRHFGTGKKDKLFAFDKQSEKSFPTNVKNVAAESRFYDFDIEGHELTIEPGLERVESTAKPVIKKILDEDSLVPLSGEDRAALSIFFAVQFIRTKWFRQQFRELPKKLEEHARRVYGDDVDLSGIADHIRVPDDNELAFQTAGFIMKHSRDFALQFANKAWMLAATDTKHPFMIGDHPIGLQNHIDMGPYGNLGLGVKGIEIYFPLSPRRALAMWCPSLHEAFRTAVQVRGEAGARAVLQALENGSPLQYTPEHVMNFNSLQIAHAERFVFSSADEFSLAKRMLADNPSFRIGMRSTSN
jgi:hypothetical protein